MHAFVVGGNDYGKYSHTTAPSSHGFGNMLKPEIEALMQHSQCVEKTRDNRDSVSARDKRLFNL